MHFNSLRSTTPRSVALIALSLLGLTACDPETITDAGTDAGPTGDTPSMADAGRDAPAAMGTCDGVRSVNLTVGENTITGDTTGRSSTLALGCGDGSPQEAVQIVVPGTGMMGVVLDLANDGTDFDTVLEIRVTCASDTDSFCNDDAADTRSRVAFPVPGGTTLTVIVSGYDAEESGPWEMTATVVENPVAPVLTGADALMIDGETLRMSVMGTDANMDANGVYVEFLDAAGATIAVDLDGDPGTPDQTEVVFDFDNDTIGMSPFTGELDLTGFDEYPTWAAAPQVRLRAVDQFGLESAPMTFDLVTAAFASIGDSCDATNICRGTLECTAAVCALPPAIATACDGATALALTAPTAGVAATTMATGSVPVGDGVLTATCQPETPGVEVFYDITLPAGTNDLIVNTENATTGDADTVVYLMTNCGDNASDPEEYCSDDIDAMGMNYATNLEVRDLAAGDYTVGVELWQRTAITAAVPVGLTFTLRPVLDAGAACDPAGVDNRCSTGTCPSSMLCPAAPPTP